MNVREYISSGIIESYVLGIASESERQEFETLSAQHPEIAEARSAFEMALETRLLSDAPEPPVQLKQQIEERLAILTPASETSMPEEQEAPVRSIGIWKWIAAALFILLASTVYWAYNTNKKNQDLQANNQKLEQQLQQSNSRIDSMQKDMDVPMNPSVIMASLKSMPVAPGASAKVFWDTTSKDVYLIINNLPQPASDKQYQLWALLDKKPVDLGVFELTQHPLMVKMKNVQNAQAFAISLEPKGGSTAPTGDIYVMGKL